MIRVLSWMMIMIKFKFIDSLKDKRKKERNIIKTTVTELMIFEFLKLLVNTEMKMSLNWSRRVESSRSSRVLNSSRLDSSQNSWLEYSSWVEMFDLSI